ncbi:MAG: hypothetical protein ACK6D1_15215, partial [Planctomycetota bacterium]
VVREGDPGVGGVRFGRTGECRPGAHLLARIAAVVGGAPPRRTAPRALVRTAATALRWWERCRGSRPPLTSDVLTLATKFLWYDAGKAARELGWRAGPVDAGIAAAWRELQGG